MGIQVVGRAFSPEPSDDASLQLLAADTHTYYTCDMGPTVVPGVGPVTIGAWAWSEATTNAAHGVIAGLGDEASGTLHAYLAANSSGTKIEAYQKNGAGNATATAGTLEAKVWRFVAARLVGDASRFAYYHGTMGSENTGSEPFSSNYSVFRILGEPESGPSATRYWEGRIKHVAIWASDLGQTELDEMLRGRPPTDVYPDKLAFYAPLTDGRAVDPISYVYGRVVPMVRTSGSSAVVMPSRQVLRRKPFESRSYVVPAAAGIVNLRRRIEGI